MTKLSIRGSDMCLYVLQRGKRGVRHMCNILAPRLSSVHSFVTRGRIDRITVRDADIC